MKNTIIKKYFYENISPAQRKHTDEISCMCFSNTTDFPILHSHEDYWEFTVLIKGSLKNETLNGTHIIQPGMLFMSDTDDIHRIVNNSPESSVYSHNITVKESVIESLLELFPKNSAKAFIKNKSPFYALSPDMLTRIEHSVYNYNSLDASKYELGTTILLSLVFQLLGFVISKKSELENTYENHEFFRVLANIISDPAFIVMSVSELCKKMNYSRTQLNHIFQKELNMSPHDYLVEKRMAYAQNLLLQSDLNVVDIGQKIGYANLSQFNVIFKRFFGMSPGQFRKQKGINKKAPAPKT